MQLSFERMIIVEKKITIPVNGTIRRLKYAASGVDAISVFAINEDGEYHLLSVEEPGFARRKFDNVTCDYLEFQSPSAFSLQTEISELMETEPNNGVAVVEVVPVQNLTRREEIERAVMIALARTKTMPSDDELKAIEGDLGWKFDDDGEDWGQGFLEEVEDQIGEEAAQEPLTAGEADLGGDGAETPETPPE